MRARVRAEISRRRSASHLKMLSICKAKNLYMFNLRQCMDCIVKKVSKDVRFFIILLVRDYREFIVRVEKDDIVHIINIQIYQYINVIYRGGHRILLRGYIFLDNLDFLNIKPKIFRFFKVFLG